MIQLILYLQFELFASVRHTYQSYKADNADVEANVLKFCHQGCRVHQWDR